MEYTVSGNLIRSHNTAKSHTQQSQAVVDYLNSQEPVKSALDFGCGKLRYSDVIVDLCERATFVDSQIQISRTQVIRGEKTTVATYVTRQYPHCKVVAYENLAQNSCRYDFIICTNVLSAIPCKKTLHEVLAHMRRLLRSKGKAVFVNQHCNSYFKKYEKGKRHLYGYLFSGRNRVSYYGILGPHEMKALLLGVGFSVERVWSVRGSNFVEAIVSANKTLKAMV